MGQSGEGMWMILHAGMLSWEKVYCWVALFSLKVSVETLKDAVSILR